jgi:cyclic pyranopterin phosphate synthase
MVDVGAKPVTLRVAIARARVRLGARALAALRPGRLDKGDALAVARLAGIQAAKRTAEWIPLCHPLPLDHVEVTIEVDEKESMAAIHARAQAQARTGVEMEALVAAAAAALALYDMLKSVDRAMVIEELLVVEKRGGKSGAFRHPRVARSSRRGTADR